MIGFDCIRFKAGFLPNGLCMQKAGQQQKGRNVQAVIHFFNFSAILIKGNGLIVFADKFRPYNSSI
jgi:hypothetical protein